MINIKKFNIASEAIVEVPFPSNDLFRWMEKEAINPSENVLIVEHTQKIIKGKPKLSDKDMKAKISAFVRNGIVINNTKFVPVIAGSSQLRNAMSTWLSEEAKPRFLAWWTCGIDDTINMVANKTMVYRALSMSSSNPWEVSTWMPPVNIDKVAVVKDGEASVETKFDVVNTIIERKKTSVSNKFTDGIAWYILDDTKMSNFERACIRYKLEAFTIRAPGVKGLLDPKLLSDVIAACDALGLGYEFVDAFGRTCDIRKTQVILHCSVFKWSKCISGPKGWAKYVEGFKANGHAFSVCVKEHDNISDLPYQQFQTLMPSEEDVRVLAERSIEKLSMYEDIDNAPYLLPKKIGAVAKIYAPLMKDAYVASEMQAMYGAMRQRMAGGRIPAICKYKFAAPDPVAVLCNIFGKKPMSAIPMRHVISRGMEIGKDIDVTRCPHLDHAHLLRRVWKPYPLCTAQTMYFSILDASMNALQMDYDGDHVAVCEDENIVRMAKEQTMRINNYPLLYEAQGAKAGIVTDAQIEELLVNIVPAPVGLYANTLTKVWARIPVKEDKEPEAAYRERISKDMRNIAYLTRSCNLCIDRAKYGKNAVLTCADRIGDSIVLRYREIAKPLFLAYAKTSAQDPSATSEFASKCVLTDGAVDKYSAMIRRHTLEQLKVEGLDETDEFKWQMLTSGKASRSAVAGLVGVGHNNGLFNQLAFRKAEEWAEVKQSADSQTALYQFEAASNEKIRKAVFQWAADKKLDFATVLDSMIMAIHVQRPESTMQLKRVLWNCFAEEILANVKNNVEANYIPSTNEEIEVEADDSEAYEIAEAYFEEYTDGLAYADEQIDFSNVDASMWD